MSQLQRLVIASNQFENANIILTAPQQHYLQRVLRLQEGDRFIAVDHTGRWLLSQLTSSHQATVIEEVDGDTELPISITLMMAMPKQGMDDIVRACTEFGVTTIQPVISDRTILKPSAQKIERWQRIAEEAAEQSERRLVPHVLSPEPFSLSVTRWAIASPSQSQPDDESSSDHHRKGYLCVARHNAPHLLTMLSQSPSIPGRDFGEIMIAVGPEGGWTTDEVQMAIAHGYQPVSLGQRIFRAVTAPMVALSLVASTLECDDRSSFLGG